jgi:polyphosphate kinase
MESGYLNRELSWLAFNERVLTLAGDSTRPVLERAKFLAIVSQNLDEFFQVRVGVLKEQHRAGLTASSFDGMTPLEQLGAIRPNIEALIAEQGRIFHEEVVPALEPHGIRLVNWAELDDDGRAELTQLFERHVFPVLTPLAVDPAHPFPYISDLSLNLAVAVREPGLDDIRFARVKIPPILARFLVLTDGETFVPIEQVVAAHLDRLFPGMEVVDQHTFRVTRDADLGLDEDGSEDLIGALEAVLKRRKHSASPVRLEVDTTMSPEMLELLGRELELQPSDVYVVRAPLDLSGLWSLYSLERPSLRELPWVGTTQPRLAAVGAFPPDIFRVLREGDVLVHHPYDAFATSVEALIDQAANDPDTLAIKQTLYRTSGPESPIVRGLIRAAEAGKQVVALVELKARFDEEANIAWARTLERAGVHVVYGVVGLKTHAKVALIVRREEEGIRQYCHVGTGNYNPNTAETYEDVGLMSADPVLAEDVAHLFNYLTGYSCRQEYERLLIAPRGLRSRLLSFISAEAGHLDGRIVMKMNSLADPEIIGALYAASQAGTQIDLVVRGICCLRPGVPNLSENIRVRSLLGRYLEHSRVFCFGNDLRGRQYFIGSADLMQRNLDSRVEAIVPILDERLQQRMSEMLDLALMANVDGWELHPDGTWTRMDGHGINLQRELQQLALARTHAVPAYVDG